MSKLDGIKKGTKIEISTENSFDVGSEAIVLAVEDEGVLFRYIHNNAIDGKSIARLEMMGYVIKRTEEPIREIELPQGTPTEVYWHQSIIRLIDLINSHERELRELKKH